MEISLCLVAVQCTLANPSRDHHKISRSIDLCALQPLLPNISSEVRTALVWPVSPSVLSLEYDMARMTTIGSRFWAAPFCRVYPRIPCFIPLSLGHRSLRILRLDDRGSNKKRILSHGVHKHLIPSVSTGTYATANSRNPSPATPHSSRRTGYWAAMSQLALLSR